MTAGKLASAKPGATTNTVLYRCPTTVTGSTVLNVCNQGSGSATYRAALRDYDQVLHLNGANTSTYKFAKGNPITGYKINILPGLQYSAAIPGTQFQTTNAAYGKILDIFKDISDVTYFSKVARISSLALATDSQAGTFQGGETLTGATSGFTATFRGIGGAGTSVNAQYTDVASGATSFNVSRNTGLGDGMYLTLGPEVTAVGGTATEVVTIDSSGINTTTNVLTITRGVLGTTARAIPAGLAINAWSASATVTTIDEGGTYAAGDTTLTVADSTGFISGGFVLIDNEIIKIDAVNGNDLTVQRARYGTGDVDHNNGVNVTLLTDNGVYLANYWTESESFTGGTSNASATVDFDVSTQATDDTKYIVSLTSAGATDHILETSIQFTEGRKYIFDLSDSSNTNYPLKLSTDDSEGPNGSGTEYTQGVSKVGTAGQAGAYTSIDVTESTDINMFAYADGSPAGSTTGVGFGVQVQSDPVYAEVYIYDVTGEPLVAGDTFTINNVTQTIQPSGVTAGPYGYVQGFDASTCHLKVALGEGSAAFAANDEFYDNPTLNNGTRTMAKAVTGKALTVNSIGAADASRSAGTYASISPNATGGSGDLTTSKFTVVVDGSGAATVTIIDGGFGHAASDTLTINDSQLGGGGGAALTFDVATISTAVHTDQTSLYSDGDYFFYDKAIATKVTDKNTSIVVGPGENLLVYSSAADLSYVVNGFESPSDDFTVVNMQKVSSGG